MTPGSHHGRVRPAALPAASLVRMATWCPISVDGPLRPSAVLVAWFCRSTFLRGSVQVGFVQLGVAAFGASGSRGAVGGLAVGPAPRVCSHPFIAGLEVMGAGPIPVVFGSASHRVH